jgi:hypothetical protein
MSNDFALADLDTSKWGKTALILASRVMQPLSSMLVAHTSIVHWCLVHAKSLSLAASNSKGFAQRSDAQRSGPAIDNSSFTVPAWSAAKGFH